MAPDVERRLNYFNGQFLQEKDFTDEQAYHIDRQRRHNRLLHTPGIAEGLDVEAGVGARGARVKPGTAVDAEGRFIVLAQERPVDFKEQHFGQTVLLVISYDEKKVAPATVGEAKETRWHEQPCVEVVLEDKASSPETHIQLARLVISKEGTLSREPDISVRRGAGVSMGQAEVHRLTLARDGVDSSQWPALSCGAAKRIDLTGDLTVTGNVGIGTTEPEANLDVKGDLKVGGKLSFDTPPIHMKRFQLGRLSAIDLDGQNDYVEIKPGVWFDGGPFTIEGWVFLREYANQCRLIDFGNGHESDNIIVYFPSTTGRPKLSIINTPAGRLEPKEAPQPIGKSCWVHVAATFEPNQSNSVAKLYLDGAEVSSGVGKIAPNKVPRAKNYIGKSNWPGEANTNGYIDEVRIWDRALSEDEIRAYMHRRVRGDEEGLVACWDFENGKVNNRVNPDLGGYLKEQPGNGLRVPRDHDTGYSVQEWVAISASYVEPRVQEGGSGEHLLLVQLDGRWFIRADNFRNDRQTQPQVEVLFMPRGWVTGPE